MNSAPAQTHIFLRAPRRFQHPSWVPRQNYTKTLDDSLQDFVSQAVGHPLEDTHSKKRRPRGTKLEGVWVSCKSGPTAGDDVDIAGILASEEDEMIWWEWRDKIVGFSEW